MNKVCWMNVVLIALFHKLPNSMVRILSTFGLTGAKIYSNLNSEFVANAYHLVNMHSRNATTKRIIFSGNAVYTPSSMKLLDIFEKKYNSRIIRANPTKISREIEHMYYVRDKCQDLNEMMHCGLLRLCNLLHPFETSFCVPEYSETYKIKGKDKTFDHTKDLSPYFGLDYVQYRGWFTAYEEYTDTLSKDKSLGWKTKMRGQQKNEFQHNVREKQKAFTETMSPKDIKEIFFGTRCVEKDELGGDILKEFETDMTDTDTQFEKIYTFKSFSILQTGSGEHYFGDKDDKKARETAFFCKYKFVGWDGEIELMDRPISPRRKATYKPCCLVYRTMENDDPNIGHYVAIVRQPHNGKWRYYDDSVETFELDDSKKEKWDEEYNLLCVMVFMSRIGDSVANG